MMTQNPDLNKQKLLQCIEEAVSAEKKDNERILLYFEECDQLGLEVLPLDVNKSESDCTFEDETSLRLGLSALIPEEDQFLEEIIANRREKGPFQTFQDFCERIDLDIFPDPFLLSCVEAGLFDSTGISRARLFLGYAKIIQAVQKSKAEQSTNQISLFEMLPTASKVQLEQIPIPEAESWTDEKTITHEKNALGFSFTEYLLHRQEEDNPENGLEEPEKELSVSSEIPSPKVAQEEQAITEDYSQSAHQERETEDAPVSQEMSLSNPSESVIKEEPVSLESIPLETSDALAEEKTIETEETTVSPPSFTETPPLPPAEFTEEDLGAFFPQGNESDASVIAEERLESEFSSPESESEPKISPEPKTLEESASAIPAEFVIQLQTDKTTEHTLLQLRECLEKSPGEVRVILEFTNDQRATTFVKTHTDYSVQISEKFVETIESISGKNTTRIV